MADKRNEILEEQRRAREEFLKLKKMQSGEIKPEAKPSEVYTPPKTFLEKLQNYWYHFKFQTILAAFFVVVIAVLTVQCATREKYDFSVMYFAYNSVLDSQLEKMEEYFESTANDLNNDGKVNVNIMNCSVSPNSQDVSYRNTMFLKVQATIAAEYSTILYVIDDSAKEYFENGIGGDLFAEEPIVLSKEFIKQISVENAPLQENLMIGLRRVKGTAIEKEEKAVEIFNECKRIFDEIKKQKS